MQEARSQ